MNDKDTELPEGYELWTFCVRCKHFITYSKRDTHGQNVCGYGWITEAKQFLAKYEQRK